MTRPAARDLPIVSRSRSLAFFGNLLAHGLDASAHRTRNIKLVVLDQSFDALAGLTGVHANVSDRATQPHIIPNEVFALGLLQQFVDVFLLYSKPAGKV